MKNQEINGSFKLGRPYFENRWKYFMGYLIDLC